VSNWCCPTTQHHKRRAENLGAKRKSERMWSRNDRIRRNVREATTPA